MLTTTCDSNWGNIDLALPARGGRQQGEVRDMSKAIGVNLHYRCAFDILPKNGETESIWGDAVKLVRRWIDQKERVEDLHKSWFFRGGWWRGRSRAPSEVVTDCFEGRGTPEAPEHWAARYEHACSEIGPDVRWWRTDIGLTRLQHEPAYRVSVSNYHWIVPGYLGEDPPPPPTSAPRLVRSLVQGGRWQSRAGSESLANNPQILEVGEGKRWVDRLTDSARTCPLVYLSPFENGQPNWLHAGRLASLLSGAAIVVYGERSSLDDELRWVLPQDFRCWDGAVRVYFPGIDLSNRFDGKRHRFFSASRIEALGPDAVEEMLVVGLARRSPVLSPDDVSSVEDVATRKREARLAKLREENADRPTPEMLTLFEEENRALNLKTRELEDQVKTVTNSVDMLSLEKEDLLAEVADSKRELRAVHVALAEAEGKARQFERGLKAFHELDRLPGSVDEVVELAKLIFPSQLRFTERAMKAARDASINAKPAEMGYVWSVFRMMATVLHTLHFDRSGDASGDIESDFETRTGFGLALTETGMTKNDAALMKLRRDTYKDEAIDITAHVKYGDNKPPRLLRVYYYPHHQENVLVVGHVGDHLDTAGTRRMR